MTTKERIMEEALTLFVERGYDGSSDWNHRIVDKN
jgi:AcrR family transcriptional regulator